MRQRPRQRGITLVEILASLAILALVLTLSIAVFFDREKKLREAAEMMAAWQVIANEAEFIRALPFDDARLVEAEHDRFFHSELISEPGLEDRLIDARPRVVVEHHDSATRLVYLELTWGERDRFVRTVVVRTAADGDGLW